MTPFVRDRVVPVVGFVIGLAGLLIVGAYIVMPHVRGHGPSTVGGPFALVSPENKPVTQQILQGHPTLVFFGYTNCPDVCPATLAEISAVFKAIGPNDEAAALFITVDPQRDTPVVMKDYLTSFDPRITGLTGSPEAVKQVEQAYKVYAKAVPDKDGTYTMDHTAITYLMDKNGEFVGAFNLDRPPKEAAEELKRYF